MILHWLFTVAALLVAAAAWTKARRLSKRLERLTESYWELRYEHGQLRARVNRLDPEEPAAGAGGPAGPGNSVNRVATDPASAPGTVAFVPLSSLKR